MTKKFLIISFLIIRILFFHDNALKALPIEKDSTQIKQTSFNSYPAINLLSTHPLGLFISRIDNNLQTQPIDYTLFNLNIASGNVWLPYVIAYRPIDPEVRKLMEGIVWHGGWNHFDASHMPSDTDIF